jgi:uncharacterized membrane protein
MSKMKTHASRFALCAVLASVLAVSFAVLPPPTTTAQSKPDLSISVMPFFSYVEVQAGRDNSCSIEIRNTGYQPLPPLTLSVEKPEGWTVVFDHPEIPGIAGYQSQEVQVNIHPPASTFKGDYDIAVIASGTGIERKQSIQVRVRFASFWIWVVLGAAAVIVGVFVVIFMKVSRRG